MAELKYQHGTADFFLLFSKDGIADVQFLRGDESLKPAAAGLGKVQYKMEFPDEGLEMIARRGILSCSQITTPSCTFVLLLPANTTKEGRSPFRAGRVRFRLRRGSRSHGRGSVVNQDGQHHKLLPVDDRSFIK